MLEKASFWTCPDTSYLKLVYLRQKSHNPFELFRGPTQKMGWEVFSFKRYTAVITRCRTWGCSCHCPWRGTWTWRCSKRKEINPVLTMRINSHSHSHNSGLWIMRQLQIWIRQHQIWLIYVSGHSQKWLIKTNAEIQFHDQQERKQQPSFVKIGKP